MVNPPTINGRAVKSFSINMMLGYSNDPSFYIETDGDPLKLNEIYDSHDLGDDNTAYICKDGDLLHFVAHCPKSETGYGGVTFKFQMRDGSLKHVKGPWSSRMDVMRPFVTEDYVWVSLNRRSAHVKKSKINEILALVK